MARPQKISNEEILSAARALFVREGPQASLDRLAEELEVSSAALFKRFGTKQKLLLAALTPEMPKFILALADGPDARPVRLQLEEIATQFFLFLREALPCLLALRTQAELRLPEHAGRPAPVLIQQGLAEFVEKAQRAGRLGEGDPLAIAQALVGGLHARVMLEVLGGSPEREPAELIQSLIDILYRGIAPAADAGPSAPQPPRTREGQPLSLHPSSKKV